MFECSRKQRQPRCESSSAAGWQQGLGGCEKYQALWHEDALRSTCVVGIVGACRVSDGLLGSKIQKCYAKGNKTCRCESC